MYLGAGVNLRKYQDAAHSHAATAKQEKELI